METSSPATGWAVAGVWTSVTLLIILIIQTAGGWSALWRWFFPAAGAAGAAAAAAAGAAPAAARSWSQWAGQNVGAAGAPLYPILAAVLLFIPDTAVLGGFIADISNWGNVRYTPTSVTGILAAVLNSIISYFMNGSATATEYVLGNPAGTVAGAVAAAATTAAAAANPLPGPAPAAAVVQAIATGDAGGGGGAASVGSPGSVSTLVMGGRRSRRPQMGGARLAGNPSRLLGMPLGSKDMPAGLAALTAILLLFCLDAWVGDKRSSGQAVSQSLFSILVVAGYVWVYRQTEGLAGWAFLVTILAGLIAGSSAYAVMKTTYPDSLPLDPEVSPSPTGEYSKCSGKLGENTPGGTELVCDAYLNGERIGTVPT